jgi:hypothetical protein
LMSRCFTQWQRWATYYVATEAKIAVSLQRLSSSLKYRVFVAWHHQLSEVLRVAVFMHNRRRAFLRAHLFAWGHVSWYLSVVWRRMECRLDWLRRVHSFRCWCRYALSCRRLFARKKVFFRSQDYRRLFGSWHMWIEWCLAQRCAVLNSEAGVLKASSQRNTLLSRALQSRLVAAAERRAVQQSFAGWKALTVVERCREAAVKNRLSAINLANLSSPFSRWRQWTWTQGEDEKLFKRAVCKLYTRRLCAAFRAWHRCVVLSQHHIAAEAWSRQQVIASAFVVWCDRVREKRLASIVKNAEGERDALTEAEARAQASLSEREFRIGLLESQLASREHLLQQQQADLDGARSRARFLEGQLADTVHELQTANAEQQVVQAAVSERGLQVQELVDAARETSRLKAENELLAESLEGHATKERELAFKVDEIENALLDEQATNARLQLQYEAQLRVGSVPLHRQSTVGTAHVLSPEDASEQFSSPGSAHSSREVSCVEVEFHELPQRTATHVSTSTPRETQRLALSPVRKSSAGRSERTELFI